MDDENHSESSEEHSSPRRNLAEWTGILAAPLAWAANQAANYALVQWACTTRKLFVLRATSAGFLLLALAGGFVSWQLFRRVRRKPFSDSDDPDAPREQFMAALGLFTTGLFALIIAAQAIGTFMIDPCQD